MSVDMRLVKQAQLMMDGGNCRDSYQRTSFAQAVRSSHVLSPKSLADILGIQVCQLPKATMPGNDTITVPKVRQLAQAILAMGSPA